MPDKEVFKPADEASPAKSGTGKKVALGCLFAALIGIILLLALVGNLTSNAAHYLNLVK